MPDWTDATHTTAVDPETASPMWASSALCLQTKAVRTRQIWDKINVPTSIYFTAAGRHNCKKTTPQESGRGIWCYYFCFRMRDVIPSIEMTSQGVQVFSGCNKFCLMNIIMLMTRQDAAKIMYFISLPTALALELIQSPPSVRFHSNFWTE